PAIPTGERRRPAPHRLPPSSAPLSRACPVARRWNPLGRKGGSLPHWQRLAATEREPIAPAPWPTPSFRRVADWPCPTLHARSAARRFRVAVAPAGRPARRAVAARHEPDPLSRHIRPAARSDGRTSRAIAIDSPAAAANGFRAGRGYRPAPRRPP